MRRIVLLLALTSLLAAPVTAQPYPALFDATSVVTSTSGGAAFDRTVARERKVVVNGTALAASAGTPGSRLQLELFDGQLVTITRDRAEIRTPANWTWFGQVQYLPHSQVVLTAVDGVLAGTLFMADARAGRGAVYRIQFVGADTLLQELRQDAFPPDHPPATMSLFRHTEEAPVASTRSGAVSDNLVTGAESSTTVDVMVVYSANTASAAGTGIAAQIQNSLDVSNAAYVNSGVPMQLRLVYSAALSYVESGDLNTDLNRITTAGDGYMDEVQTWRDVYGADVVTLWVENSAYCGLGWTGPSEDYMFTVVNRGCAGGNLSMAHEIGHNFGALHDPYVDMATAPYTYGHGYVDVRNRFRTVMAYNDQCAVSGFNCTRIPSFSAVAGTYNGFATGNPSVSDNARVLTTNAPVVAAYRTPPCTYTLSPTSSSVADTASTGTVAVTTQTGCVWNATTDAGWLAFSATATSGPGTLTWTAAANTTASARSAKLTVGGRVFTLTQAAPSCVYSLAVASATIGAAATSGATALATGAACTWQAASAAPSWLTVSPAFGTGPASVAYAATANTGAQRAANFTAGGQSFLLTQAAGCAYSLSPTSASVTGAPSAGTLTLTTSVGCPWSASSDAVWLLVTTPHSGNGDSTLGYSVAANPGGPRMGTVTVAGQTFAVTQAAATKRITLTPSALTFPSMAVGVTSVAQAVQVTADGGLPVALAAVVVSSDYAVSHNCGASLSAGATCTLAVTFTPTFAGSRTGTLTLFTDATNTPHAVNLTGTGVGASFSVTPATLAFGNVLSGAHVTMTATVTNNGSATGTPSFSGNPSSFALTGCEVALAPGASCMASVEFSPYTAFNNYSGIYYVTPGGSQGASLNVSGTGASPMFSLSTPTLAFGSVTLGTTSAAQTVTVTNSGNAPGAPIFYGNPAGFARTGCTSPIAAGGSCTTTVTFTPTVAQAYSDMYTIGGGYGMNTGLYVTGMGTTASCSYALTPTSASIGAAAATGSTNLATGATCVWTASSSASWLMVLSAASGTGPTAVNWSASANSGAARSATVSVNGQTFTVSQAAAPCTYVFNPTNVSVGSAPGGGNANLATGSACSWTASSNATWLTLYAVSGTGPALMGYSVAPNTGAARSATITANGATFTVAQAASTAPCTYVVTPNPVTIPTIGGKTTVNVTTGPSCAWQATPSDASWLSVSPVSGTGTGTFSLLVQGNRLGARSGTVDVSGTALVINQTDAVSCSYSLSPTSTSATAPASTGSTTLTTGVGCLWTASSLTSWLTLTSATSGSGNAVVSYAVATNTGAARTGNLKVGGQTFMVSQAAAAVMRHITMSATSLTFPGTVLGSASVAQSVQMTADGGLPVAITSVTASGDYAVTHDCGTSLSAGATCNLSASFTPTTQGYRSGTLTVVTDATNSPHRVSLNGTGTATLTVTPASLSFGNVLLGTSAAMTVTVTNVSASAQTPGFSANPTAFAVSGCTSALAPGATCTATVVFNPGSPAAGYGGTYFVFGGGGDSTTFTVSGTGAVPNFTLSTGALDFGGTVVGTTSPAQTVTLTNTGNAPGTPVFVTAPLGFSRTGCVGTLAPGASCVNSVTFTPLAAQAYSDMYVIGAPIGMNFGFLVTGSGTTPSCSYALTPSSASIGDAATSGSTDLATGLGCGWGAASSASWLALTSATMGTGASTVEWSAAANAGAARTATLTVGGKVFMVNQAGAPCYYAFTPAATTLPATAGPGSSWLGTSYACSWAPTSSAPWLTVTSVGGTGSATVNFSAAANTGAARTGTITANGAVLTVTQAAGTVACAYDVSPNPVTLPLAGGMATITVTTGASCAWQVSAPSGPWLSASPQSGTGPGSFTVTAMASRSAQTATVNVSGTVLTVNQLDAKCAYDINPVSANASANGGTGSTTLTAGSGCAWKVSSNAAWLTLTSASSGSGSATIGYIVAANAGAARSGTLTVAGQVYTVNQAAGSVACTYSLNPMSASVGAVGATGSSALTTDASCAWTAASNAAWLTLTSPASGSGSTTVAYSVAPNAGAARIGMITVGAQTLTVSQAAGNVVCTYSLSPTSASISAAAGTGSASLSTGASCAWTASSSASWLTLTSAASGTGSVVVVWAAAANSGSTNRTATVFIGGRTLTVTQAHNGR